MTIIRKKNPYCSSTFLPFPVGLADLCPFYLSVRLTDLLLPFTLAKRRPSDLSGAVYFSCEIFIR